MENSVSESLQHLLLKEKLPLYIHLCIVMLLHLLHLKMVIQDHSSGASRGHALTHYFREIQIPLLVPQVAPGVQLLVANYVGSWLLQLTSSQQL